jgi:hypothetical protein
MIHMPLKWHHINKCNKNCKKIDVLTSILVHLSSFASCGAIYSDIQTQIFTHSNARQVNV